MKFSKLLNGPTAAGESFARALDGVDAPFVTHAGPDSTAQKKGIQTQVRQGLAPYRYLWASFVRTAGGAGGSAGKLIHFDVPDMRIGTHYEGYTADQYWVTSSDIQATAVRCSIGDGYIMTLRASQGAPYVVSHTWATIAPVLAAGVQALPSDAKRYGPTTFVGQLQTSGYAENDLSLYPFALGAVGGKDDGFFAGVGFLKPADPDHPMTTRTPAIWGFNTKDKTMQQKPAPHHPDRDHLDFTVFTTGKGKAEYLYGVHEEMDPATEYMSMKPLIPLKLANTTDFCNSFNTTDATFLEPFLVKWRSPWYPVGREIYWDIQLDYLTKYATIVHIGNGENLLYIPAGYDPDVEVGLSPGDEPVGDAATFYAKYHPLLFKGSGGSYSRVAWPPDSWRVYANGDPDDGLRVFHSANVYRSELAEKNSIGFHRRRHTRSLQWSFGVGCMYVPVYHEDDGWRFMFTRDAGSSWSFAPIPGYLHSIRGGGPNGAVVRPYKGADDKGEIVFVGREPGTRNITYYRTDGDFAEFKPILKNKIGRGTSVYLFPSSVDYGPEDQVIYFGGERGKQYVFPAFPGEFEPE